MNAKVSLITPVYNAMPYLEDYLRCVAAQTWRPLQLILSDDGSEDGSRECMEQMKSMLEDAGVEVILLFCSHFGQAAATNEALQHINGEFFTWCDADDLMTCDSIEKKVLWLEANPEIGMVRSNGVVRDMSTGKDLYDSSKPSDRATKNIFEELFCDKTYCYAGCYMIRTSLFFEGYPQRQMPLSPEGQNLQLLLPSASRSLCGYLDEKLHTYCRREGTHSNKKRSYSQTLARIENFRKLRLAVLEHCRCDKPYFEELARKTAEKAKTNLVLSAVQHLRKEREK